MLEIYTFMNVNLCYFLFLITWGHFATQEHIFKECIQPKNFEHNNSVITHTHYHY